MSDCSKHKKDVAEITDMKELAEMIGDLHYEALTTLLMHLSAKIKNDAKKDKEGERLQLARKLYRSGDHINSAFLSMYEAWKISEPFMK